MAKINFSKECAGMAVEGEISFKSVNTLCKNGVNYIESLSQGQVIQLRFQQVTRCDLSALALIIAWMRACLKRSIHVKLIHLPLSIIRMAEVCGVKDLIEDKKDLIEENNEWTNY